MLHLTAYAVSEVIPSAASKNNPSCVESSGPSVNKTLKKVTDGPCFCMKWLIWASVSQKIRQKHD